jgi:hypothetical protein
MRVKLEKQIYRLLWEYPTGYHDRTEALCQFFIVGGTGYHWQAGELRTEGDTKKLTPFEALNEGWIRHYTESTALAQEFGITEEIERVAQKLADDLAQTQQARVEIEERIRTSPPIEHLYPLSEFTKLCNLPDDIKLDWLDGAQEAVDLALVSPASAVSMSYAKTPEQQEKEYQENQRYLHLVQNRINELKVGRN